MHNSSLYPPKLLLDNTEQTKKTLGNTESACCITYFHKDEERNK